MGKLGIGLAVICVLYIVVSWLLIWTGAGEYENMGGFNKFHVSIMIPLASLVLCVLIKS